MNFIGHELSLKKSLCRTVIVNNFKNRREIILNSTKIRISHIHISPDAMRHMKHAQNTSCMKPASHARSSEFGMNPDDYCHMDRKCGSVHFFAV